MRQEELWNDYEQPGFVWSKSSSNSIASSQVSCVISQKLSPRASQNHSSTLEGRPPFSAYGILSTLSKSFSA